MLKNNPSPDPFLTAPRCLRCGLKMPEFGICPPCQETAGKWIPLPKCEHNANYDEFRFEESVDSDS